MVPPNRTVSREDNPDVVFRWAGRQLACPAAAGCRSEHRRLAGWPAVGRSRAATRQRGWRPQARAAGVRGAGRARRSGASLGVGAAHHPCLPAAQSAPSPASLVLSPRRNEAGKWKNVVLEIKRMHKTGRPVLVSAGQATRQPAPHRQPAPWPGCLRRRVLGAGQGGARPGAACLPHHPCSPTPPCLALIPRHPCPIRAQVGTTSVEKSELLAGMLDEAGIPYQVGVYRLERMYCCGAAGRGLGVGALPACRRVSRPPPRAALACQPGRRRTARSAVNPSSPVAPAPQLLNAKPENVERESEIVAQSGRRGAVTIATNMAGRGTDILLGGNPGGRVLGARVCRVCWRRVCRAAGSGRA